jgi:hypothetical protein
LAYGISRGGFPEIIESTRITELEKIAYEKFLKNF